MVKNRLLYAALFFSSFLFVYFWGGKIPYMLFYMVTLLPILSLIYILLVFLAFKYTQRIDKTELSKGESFRYIFTIHNRGLLLAPYIKAQFMNLDKTITNKKVIYSYSATPISKKTYSFDVECNNRGVFDIGLLRVEITDFLGIFRFIKKPKHLFSITVYPRIVLLDAIDNSMHNPSEMSGIKKSIQNSSTNVSDIRKYTNGDSFRSIHWKLTATKNELMVKDKHSIADFNTVILLDLNVSRYRDEGKIAIGDILIESAVALIYYSLSANKSIKLLYFDYGLTTIDANIYSEFNDIYMMLSKVELQENFALLDILHGVPHENTVRANYFIITANIDRQIFDEIIKLKQEGHHPHVIFVNSPDSPTHSSDEEMRILEALENSGIRTYCIKNDLEIKEVLEQGY